ncbi:hypothetical protein FQN57_002926 [Myotisia sp. PD_48]|nr:hypothetical protein FQN57_002926 [Myotisia sp. PD_48]
MSTSSSFELSEDEPDSHDEQHEPTVPTRQSTESSSFSQLKNLRLEPSPLSQPPTRRPISQKYLSNNRDNYIRRTSQLAIEEYRILLRKTIDEFHDFKNARETDGSKPLGSSQIGIVTWTGKEKAAFFRALEMKGKDAVPEIAALIGTKSRIEIRAFLNLLHDRLRDLHLSGRKSLGVLLSDIPAALEVSQECCEVLGKVACALSTREENDQNVIGRRKYQDMWIVDQEIAAYLDTMIKSEDMEAIKESNKSTRMMLANAGLLVIPHWIRLSRNIFMNSGGARTDENWTKICFDGESPAMTCEAVTDFYALTVSLTRRLVQSSIYFASSRLRAIEGSGRERSQFVCKDDVATALSVLKMKHDSKEFWVRAARRNSLQVREYVNTESWETKVLSYDEVERRLRTTSRAEFYRSGEYLEPESFNGSRAVSPIEVDEYLDESPSDSSGSSGSGIIVDAVSQARVDGEEGLDEEEAHASMIDEKIDQAEELRLWHVLNRVPPQPDVKMEPEAQDSTPFQREKRPAAKRKILPELIDWRDLTFYRSEWEEYGPDAIYVKDELRENQVAKRRKLINE